MAIFNSYVSLPEGKQPIGFWGYTIFGTHMPARWGWWNPFGPCRRSKKMMTRVCPKKKHAYPTWPYDTTCRERNSWKLVTLVPLVPSNHNRGNQPWWPLEEAGGHRFKMSSRRPKKNKKYYPLVNIDSLLLKMAIEIVDLPIKNGDFP